MQLNCRILDFKLVFYDEDTLTGSECAGDEDSSESSKSTMMKAKTRTKNS